jgi:hypothetical protein
MQGRRDAAVQALDGGRLGHARHVVMDDAALLAGPSGTTGRLISACPAGLQRAGWTPRCWDALAEASPPAIITGAVARCAPRRDSRHARRGAVLARLRGGWRRGAGCGRTGLMLRYQPIICLRTGGC